jgi:hypothetical protein
MFVHKEYQSAHNVQAIRYTDENVDALAGLLKQNKLAFDVSNLLVKGFSIYLTNKQGELILLSKGEWLVLLFDKEDLWTFKVLSDEAFKQNYKPTVKLDRYLVGVDRSSSPVIENKAYFIREYADKRAAMDDNLDAFCLVNLSILGEAPVVLKKKLGITNYDEAPSSKAATVYLAIMGKLE